MNDMVTYGNATTLKESREIAVDEARRRFGRMTVGQLVEGAKADYGKMRVLGTRILNVAVTLGQRLIEIKRRTPHGGFEDELDRIGISKMQAHRCRQVAEAVALLPPTRDDGSPWTLDAAIDYGKTCAELRDDLEALEPEQRGRLIARDLEGKRKVKASTQLNSLTVKLEGKVRHALAQGDAGALATVDMIVQMGRRLTEEVEHYRREAERARVSDEAAAARDR